MKFCNYCDNMLYIKHVGHTKDGTTNKKENEGEQAEEDEDEGEGEGEDTGNGEEEEVQVGAGATQATHATQPTQPTQATGKTIVGGDEDEDEDEDENEDEDDEDEDEDENKAETDKWDADTLEKNPVHFYCKFCGNIELFDDQVSNVISRISFKNDETIEKWIKPDIESDVTLPHIHNIKCHNSMCESHKDNNGNDIILLRYNHTDVKYIYFCTFCKKYWKADNKLENNEKSESDKIEFVC